MAEVFVIEPTQQSPTKKKLLRVCAYARVSTEEDSQSSSYEFQIAYYKNLIMKNGSWTLVDIYSDKGITGTSAEKRPGFQQMIKDCRSGEIDCILVKSVSRFARNIEECLRYIRELKQLNVSVIFEKENVNTNSLDDELLLTFFGCLSEEESRSISNNIRWAFKHMMARGEFITAHAPYGYLLRSGNLYVNEKERPIVRWIYDQFMSGESCQKIADLLNQHQVPKKNKKGLWTASGVRYILLNEKYIGDAIVQKTYTTDTLPYSRKQNHGQREQYYIENAQAAIIEKTAAERVQQIFESNKTYYGPKEERLLSGKLYCGNCGSKMRYKKSRGKIYWVCQEHVKDKQACPTIGVEEYMIYEAFQSMSYKLKNNYKKILLPAKQLIELLYKDDHLMNSNYEVDQKIMKIQKQIQVLSRLRGHGHIESAFFIEKNRQLNEELKLLQGECFMRQLQGNRLVRRVNETIKAFSTWQESQNISEEVFRSQVEQVLLMGKEYVIFQLKCGFRFEERIVG